MGQNKRACAGHHVRMIVRPIIGTPARTYAAHEHLNVDNILGALPLLPSPLLALRFLPLPLRPCLQSIVYYFEHIRVRFHIIGNARI